MRKPKKPMKLSKLLPLIDLSSDVRIFLADEDLDTPAYEGSIYNIPYYLTDSYINSGSDDFEPIGAYLVKERMAGLELYVTEDPDFCSDN